MPKLQGMAVVWFCPDDYEAVKELSVDEFHDTFEEWLQGAEEGIAQAARDGLPVERVNIEAKGLAAWAERSGREVNAICRAEYAAWLLAEKHRKRHH